MKNIGKIIAIDFDGTIVKHNFPQIGSIQKNAAVVINRLFQKNEIIIWTCRTLIHHKWEMIKFLDYFGISFDSINYNSQRLNFIAEPKIYYDVLIDDQQLGGIPNWLKIEKILKKKHGVKT